MIWTAIKWKKRQPGCRSPNFAILPESYCTRVAYLVKDNFRKTWKLANVNLEVISREEVRAGEKISGQSHKLDWCRRAAPQKIPSHLHRAAIAATVRL